MIDFKTTDDKVMHLIHRLLSSVPELPGKKIVYKVTYFIDRQHVIRATLRRYGTRIPKKPPLEIILSVTRPNFEERKILKNVSIIPIFYSWAK